MSEFNIVDLIINAYEKGIIDATSNKVRENNPYPKHTQEHESWNKGFDRVSATRLIVKTSSPVKVNKRKCPHDY